MDKHYGMYRGIVTNNSDPENRYRVKLKVPQLLGQEETDWAWPCVPLNWTTGVLKNHNNHIFTDYNDGTGSSGNKADSLPHQTTDSKGNAVSLHVPIDLFPKVGTGMWVTFEGGDIDHPIWMGVWS